MANFVTWGVVGILGTIAATGAFLTYWFDPSRLPRVTEKRRVRRAKANQRWVRNRVAQNGVMARSIDHEAELIAHARMELEDPWKHLGSRS